MPDEKTSGILLRFRDLVTEPGGNIHEHRRIIDDLGFAWWGWWARSQEVVPKAELATLLLGRPDFPVILFDSGLMEFYYCRCSKVSISPVETGIASPDFRATPHYYVRGSYPAWFKLHGALEQIEPTSFAISGRPTIPGYVPKKVALGDALDANSLREENPTLWLIDQHEA